MNKVELSARIADRVDVTSRKAIAMLHAFVDIVVETLVTGGEVTIVGFGTFSAKKRKGRTGVHPQHLDKKIKIPSVTVPKFKAGRNLKNALRGISRTRASRA